MKKSVAVLKRENSQSRAPTEVDLLVGRNLRRLRNEYHMTLSDLGVALGISHQQLQKYETGANRMSAGMIHRVANVFSLPIAELFEGAGGNKASEPDSVQKARRACHSLIDRTDSAKKLTEVSRVLKALLD